MLSFWFLTIAILLGVFIAPTLALAPRLALSPRDFLLVPLISALMVVSLQSFLAAMNIFSHTYVLFLVLGLVLVASIRVAMLNRASFTWQSQDFKLFSVVLLLLTPLIVELGTTGFESGDEIYSWNFWAIQHYLQIPIDFSHTGAAYPQFLPRLLAFSYTLLGSIDYHCPVKVLLILFSFVMLLQIYYVQIKNMSASFLYWVLFAFSLLLVGQKSFFNDGYADPIMTSFLVGSFICYWYAKYNDKLAYLALSALLAIGSMWSKQPGLMWAVIGLPVLFLIDANKISLKIRLGLIAALWASAIVWFALEGNSFHQNTGVMILSFENRSLLDQLPHAFYKHFVLHPPLFILFITAIIAACYHSTLRLVMLSYFIPSMVLWLFLAAYQLRPAQHLIPLAWLFILLSPMTPRVVAKIIPADFKAHFNNPFLPVAGCLITVFIASILFVRQAYINRSHVSFLEGTRLSLVKYFNADSDKIYSLLKEGKENTFWVPSRYLYGLFYPHVNLVAPDYTHGDYSTLTLVNELITLKPNFVFTVNNEVIDGPGSQTLQQLINDCPLSFEQFNSSYNRYNFTAYKFNPETLLSDNCVRGLANGELLAQLGYDDQPK